MTNPEHVCGDRRLPCFDVYKELAMKTRASYPSQLEAITNAALGMAGEAGEVADIIKKFLVQGHKLDSAKIEEEMGDLLWYIAEMCDVLGLDMGMVARKNIMKLAERYPEGFSSEKSINRGSPDPAQP